MSWFLLVKINTEMLKHDSKERWACERALCWIESTFGLSYFSFAFWAFRIPVVGTAPR